MKKQTSAQAFGLNSSKLGNYNAASKALILDAKGNILGQCIDTPNNAAVAMFLFPDSVEVWCNNNHFKRTPEFMTRVKGCDIEYHKQYIKSISEL